MPRVKEYQTMSARDLLRALSLVNDLDADINVSILNSDAVPVVIAEENEDGQFVLIDEIGARTADEDKEEATDLEFVQGRMEEQKAREDTPVE